MEESNKKSIIDTYYNETYDIYLVVANKYATLEELQELYVYSTGEELDDRILSGAATTSTCYNKKTGAMVSLVKYNTDVRHSDLDKKLTFINTCSHEATHVALDIYEVINQTICNCSPEPFCYLQGWATQCIYKTWTKK